MKLNDTYFLNPAHLDLAKARYFLKDENGNCIETDIRESFDRVVDYIYQNDKCEHKEEAKRLRYDKKIVDAGRILSQAGTDVKNLFNCFHKDTIVMTTDGPKKISDVCVGDSVLTHTGKIEKVLQTHKNNVIDRNIYSVLCARTPKFIVTENHKFWSIKSGQEEARWNSIAELNVGDFIAIPKPLDGELDSGGMIDITKYFIPDDNINVVINNDVVMASAQFRNRGVGKKTCHKDLYDIRRFWKIDEDFAFFVGVWLGDGCVFNSSQNKIGGITFTTNNKERLLQKFLATYGSKLFGIKPRINENLEQNTGIVAFNSQIVGNVFATLFGRNFDGKRLNNIIFKWDKNLVSSLIAGIISSNGTIAENGTCKIEIENEKLVNQLYYVSRQCGIPLSMKNGHVLYKGEKRKTAKLYIPKGNDIIKRVVKTYEDRRISESFISNASKWKSINGLMLKNGQYFVRINVKDETTLDDFVYTIGVKNSHSYNVEGVLCENCFVIGFDDDTREAISELKRKHFAMQAMGGGTGINFSKLRPSGSICKRTQSRSSGAVGFITDFSYQSSNISQGGNRSGANLGALEDWHPDLYEFITKKSKANWENIRKFASVHNEDEFAYFQWEYPHQWQMFNVSVFLSDKFMEQVISKSEEPWKLEWNGVEWKLWDFVNNRGPKTHKEYKRNITVSAPNKDMARYKASSHIPYFNNSSMSLIKGPYSISAKEWFYMICKNAHEDGCPGIVFFDLVKRFHNGEYFNKISACNPCFPGDQLLLLEDGFKSFETLYNEQNTVKIVQDTRIDYVGPENDKNNPNYWKINYTNNKLGFEINDASKIIMTKKDADIVKVETNEGIVIRTTPDHHIATTNGMVSAENLNNGDKILVAYTPIWKDVNKKSKDYYIGYLFGHLLGDGNYHCSKNGSEKIILSLWGKEREIVSKITDKIDKLYINENKKFLNYSEESPRKIKPYYICPIDKTNRLNIYSVFLHRLFVYCEIMTDDKYNFSNGRLSKKEFYAGLLSGLIQTDGTISFVNKDKGLSIRINSSNYKMLQKIQNICLQYGAYGKIYKRRSVGPQSMPDGKGGEKIYIRQDNFDIIFSGISRDNLFDVVELHGEKKEKYLAARKQFLHTSKNVQFYATVKNIKSDGREDVYCLREKKRRTLVVNGISARRCAEEVMPKNSVCCLTSLALPSFFVNSKFDFKEFKKSIWQAVRGLDNIIGLSSTGEEDIDKNSLDERRIGLGTTGIAELLIMKKIKYSSERGRKFVSNIMEFFRNEAYRASIHLSKERGSFPKYNYDGFSKSDFFKTLPEDIREDIKNYGIRNVTVLTQPPVGTTGTMLGFSQGCEPYFAMCFMRNSRVGSFQDGSPMFVKWLNENDINYKDYDFDMRKLRMNKKIKVPDYFEEAHEIPWIDHLKMQAVFAKYIDASVSKTINLPSEATVEDVVDAYIMAYKLGIKSTTVYRDKSKQQILEHISEESEQTRPNEIMRTLAPKRPDSLPCDIYHTTVKGDTWTVLVGIMDDKPYEVFCAPQDSFELSPKYKNGTIVKNGGGNYHLDMGDFKLKNISGYLKNDEHRVITRLISTCLRHGVPMPFISDQLAKADGTIVDFSKAILRVLKKYDDPCGLDKKGQVCSNCGSTNVVLNNGCPECLDCGISKCG